jgi:uncharacterized membrane protein YoaK (UPF0700 family)
VTSIGAPDYRSGMTMFPMANDPKHGPLPVLLILLTMVTGLVDAVSYFKLDHVFVATMTGNVVFIGFALGGASEFSVPASIAALAAFLAGAMLGGQMVRHFGGHRARQVAIVSAFKLVLEGASLAVILAMPKLDAPAARYAMIVLLGVAMGAQNASVRRLAVPGLTTTVLTMALTGLAADSLIGGGAGVRPWRMLLGVTTMLVGAAAGAALVLHGFTWIALAIVVGLQAIVGLVAWRHASSTAPWTAP